MNPKVISIDWTVNGKIAYPIENYEVDYVIPFDKAFRENVPKSEWWKWGIVRAEYLALTRQAPLLLKVLSEYKPDKAAELVETALRIATTCCISSVLRDYAGRAIPFLKITEARRIELTKTFFWTTNMERFEEYMKSPKSEAIKLFQGYDEYLSIATWKFIYDPINTLINSVQQNPRIQGSRVLNRITIEKLNLCGLFKLKEMALTPLWCHARMLFFHPSITVESLNSPRWFKEEVSDDLRTSVTVSDIEPA